MDFDHLSEASDSNITEESLKDKMNNKEEMENIAEKLIKLENYENAKSIWNHIEILDKVNQLLVDKNKAASEEDYELAMKLRDQINQQKASMLSEKVVADFFSSSTNKQISLKNIVNQVIYRVDDCFAKYFAKSFIEKYNRIDFKDFEAKIRVKHEITIKALVLLKITKIGLERFRNNCDQLVSFLVKEVTENLSILNEIKRQDPAVLEAMKQEGKFIVFIKGIKSLNQILRNMHYTVELLHHIDDTPGK